MKKVDRTIISILALALLTAVSGCNDKKDAKVAKTTSQSSGFSLKADMCGTHMSIGEVTDGKGGGRRPVTLSVSVEICGKMEGADDKGWRALGMTLVTPTVYLRKSGSTSYDAATAPKAQLYVDGDKIVADADGKTIVIGTAKTTKHAESVKPDGGAKVELSIGDRPYQVGDAKSTPDSDKHVWITAD